MERGDNGTAVMGMYKDFYNFSEMPFSMTPDPRFFYCSRKHEEALASLIYTVKERKGFGVITGEIGAGKTTLCRAFLAQLNGDRCSTALITNTFLTGKQLIALALEDFGLRPVKGSKLDLLRQLNEFLIEQLREDNNVVLIIDEAQNLRPSVIEEVRMLSNLETDKEKLIQIILVGQPELKEKLSWAELAQFRQRVSVHYHLGPLDEEETFGYISHRLKVAGGDPELFTDEAKHEVYMATEGVPRLINKLCDRALIVGYVEERRIIDADTIKGAWEDMRSE